jgi:hypothetical protein
MDQDGGNCKGIVDTLPTDLRRPTWVIHRAISLLVFLYTYHGRSSSLQNVGMIN